MIGEEITQEFETKFPFVKVLDDKRKKQLRKQLNHVKYSPGKIIMRAGYTCENTFFLLKGSIRVYKMSEQGRQITLYRMRTGEMCLMSIACIMSDSSFPAQAQVEEETEILALPGNIFRKFLNQVPEFQEFVFAKVFSRLQDVMLTVEEIAFSNMETRIASFLISKLERNQEKLELTHAEIAREIGSAREVVSRTLKIFAEREIVSLSRGKIRILNRHSLEKIAFM